MHDEAGCHMHRPGLGAGQSAGVGYPLCRRQHRPPAARRVEGEERLSGRVAADVAHRLRCRGRGAEQRADEVMGMSQRRVVAEGKAVRLDHGGRRGMIGGQHAQFLLQGREHGRRSGRRGACGAVRPGVGRRCGFLRGVVQRADCAQSLNCQGMRPAFGAEPLPEGGRVPAHRGAERLVEAGRRDVAVEGPDQGPDGMDDGMIVSRCGVGVENRYQFGRGEGQRATQQRPRHGIGEPAAHQSFLLGRRYSVRCRLGGAASRNQPIPALRLGDGGHDESTGLARIAGKQHAAAGEILEWDLVPSGASGFVNPGRHGRLLARRGIGGHGHCVAGGGGRGRVSHR